MATSSEISSNGGQTLSKATESEETQDDAVNIWQIFDGWYKKRPNISHSMHRRHLPAQRRSAEDLYTLLGNALEASSSSMSPDNVEAELDGCLRDDRMDIYQKWWLLWVCVENDPADLAQNLARSLSKILPSLPLASAENFRDLLPDNTRNEFETTSPLHQAVKQGAIKLFKVMVAEGTRALGKARFLKLLEIRDFSGNTAFSFAVEHYQPEIVRDLFELGVKIAVGAQLNDCFHRAIERVRGRPSHREKAMRVLSDILSFENSLRTADNLVIAMGTGDEELVNLFLDGSLGPCPFDYFVAKRIIELDQWNIWEFDSVKKQSKILKTKGLLHHAVQHQRPRFVEHFLTQTPDAVAEKFPLDGETSEEEKFPLWHNNHVITSSHTKARKDSDPGTKEITKRIRDLLVSTMIKTQKMSIISDIIWDSKGTSCSV